MMASSFALRKSSAKFLMSRLRAAPPPAPAAVGHRYFNTDTQITTVGGDDDRGVDVQRRPDSSVARRRGDALPAFFSDAFDPFFGTRSLSQMMNMMDQFMADPFSLSPRGTRSTGVGMRRGWDVKEDDDVLHFRVDMPGLDRDQVKVSVEQNTLVIKGEGGKESEEEEYGRRYSSRIDLPSNLYKLDSVKAEMKNGVLKITVPKLKEEERKDAFQVRVE